MALKDSIRDSGVATSQNSTILQFNWTTQAAGTEWTISPAQAGAFPRVIAGVNVGFSADDYGKVLAGPFGDVSTEAAAKATALATKFVAGATVLNFAVGGISGRSLNSVVAVEVTWFTADDECFGQRVDGPADEFVVSGTAISGGADLVLDSDAGAVAGAITLAAAPVAALKACIKFTVKL